MARTRKHRVDDDGRECSLCNEYQPWSEFYGGAGARGKDTRCKGCMRKKTRAHGALPAVQEVERQRWIGRWETAHPGQEYVRRQFCRVDENGRECSYSGEGNCGHAYKSWSEFRVTSRAPGGGHRDARCKDCVNARNFFQRFLITEADRQRLGEVALFGKGLCDLHGGPETMKYTRHQGDWGVRGLSVDHAHDCDQGHLPERGCRYCIRGLVCCECNRTVLRMAEEHPALAARFADYLARRPLLVSAA